MVFTTVFIVACVLCFLWLTEPGGAIHIKVIPEFINGIHQGGNFTWCDLPCIYSENPQNPDAEFYIAMNDDYIRRAIEADSGAKIKILGSQEPPHYYHLLEFEHLRKHFQGTALLNRASDVPWPLMMNLDVLKKSEMPKAAKPKVTFVARNCNPMNNRNEIVKEIDDVIGIIAPSKCFNNLEWPECGDGPCSKVEVIRGYKIHLAFENGDSPGFITDKIYHAFEAGVLPVWMGTKDIKDVVPEHSYIDVAEFRTPAEIARYLKEVLENETLYNSYFQWKWEPFNAEFVRKNRLLWEESVHCRLCRYVDTLQRGLEWDHLLQRAISTKSRIESNIMWRHENRNEKSNLFFFPLLCFMFFFIIIYMMRRKIGKLFSFLLYRPTFNS